MQLMTKKNMCRAISRRQGKPYLEVRNIIDSMIEVIEDELSMGRGVRLRGLFKIRMQRYDRRKYKQPKTGEILDICAQNKPRISLSRSFRLKKRGQENERDNQNKHLPNGRQS